MKGQDISINTLVYLAIIITVVIAGTLVFVSKLSTEYSKAPNLTSINKSVELGTKIEDSYKLFKTEQNVQLGLLGDFITGAKVIWNFVLLFLDLPDALGSLINDFGASVGIPPIYLAGATVLIMFLGLVVVFKILTKT